LVPKSSTHKRGLPVSSQPRSVDETMSVQRPPYRLRCFQPCLFKAPEICIPADAYGTKTGRRKLSRFMAPVSGPCDMGIIMLYRIVEYICRSLSLELKLSRIKSTPVQGSNSLEQMTESSPDASDQRSAAAGPRAFLNAPSDDTKCRITHCAAAII